MAKDITQWLDGLRLDQYAQALADNDIDFEIVPQLMVQPGVTDTILADPVARDQGLARLHVTWQAVSADPKLTLKYQ